MYGHAIITQDEDAGPGDAAIPLGRPATSGAAVRLHGLHLHGSSSTSSSCGSGDTENLRQVTTSTTLSLSLNDSDHGEFRGHGTILQEADFRNRIVRGEKTRNR